MGLFLSQSGKKDKRLILAYTKKLLMSLTRKALRGKVSGEGIAFMLKSALYNLKSPIQAVQIVLYFLCNRPKVIGAIHGK
jgi:hypothetical protein